MKTGRPTAMTARRQPTPCLQASIYLVMGLVVLPLPSVVVAQAQEDPYYAHYVEGRRLYDKARTQEGQEVAPLYTMAIAQFDLALAQEVKPGAQYYKALCLMELKRYAEAKALLQTVSAYKTVPPRVREQIPHLLQLIEGKLAKKPVLVQIHTSPEGARILLDNVYVGLSPLRTMLTPGTYRLRITKPGYRVQTVSLEVESLIIEQRYTLQRDPDTWGVMALRTGSINGAAVHIDGESAGLTPVSVTRPPGTYRLTVTHPGYQPIEQGITFTRAGRQELDLVLLPLERPLSATQTSAYVMLGLGVASLATAGIVHALAQHQRDEANDQGLRWDIAHDEYEAAIAKRNGAFVLYGVGGTSLITSLILFLVDDAPTSLPGRK